MTHPVNTNDITLPSRSRSRSPTPFHRCSLGLTAEQAEYVMGHGVVLRSWFGNGASVPVKNSLEQAVKAFVAAKEKEPAMLLLFCLPLRLYYKWMKQNQMTKCRWVGGYRIHGDIDVAGVDPHYTLHKVHSVECDVK